jgi:hypothetical protein
MKPQALAAVTAVLLGLAGCSSSAPAAVPTQVDSGALDQFCSDVGVYATELTEGQMIEPAAQIFVTPFYAAARKIDATDPNHPDMAQVAAAITSDPGNLLWPDVAKGQAYCASAGAPMLSGAPSSAPGLP